mmetsp:Transcript_50823/g.146646  ORF Transcript_50823/g.146646 Transcript_50823/m.146646 type:complete len:148 (-) Transcript_50823:148-591(-)
MQSSNAAWAETTNEFHAVERSNDTSAGTGSQGTDKGAASRSTNRIEWPEEFSEMSSSSSGSSLTSLTSLGMGSLPPVGSGGLLNSGTGKGTTRQAQWNLQDRWPEKPGSAAQASAKAATAKPNAEKTDEGGANGSNQPAKKKSLISL